MNKQKGFTLIELVMVIVILGILAAFAVPRFADVTSDARKATVDAVAGSLRSAAALAHATSLSQSKSAGQTVTMENTSITMSAFYPTISGIINALSDYSGFTPVSSGTDTITFEKIGATTEATCNARYTEAATNAAPVISVNKAGC